MKTGSDLRDALHPWVSPAGAIGMSGFILFAYDYLRPTDNQKWLGRILVAALVAMISAEFHVAIERVIWLQSGYVELREVWRDIPFTIGFFLSICSGFSWLIGDHIGEVYQNQYMMTSPTAVRFEPRPDGRYRVAQTGYYFDKYLGEKNEITPKPLQIPISFP